MSKLKSHEYQPTPLGIRNYDSVTYATLRTEGSVRDKHTVLVTWISALLECGETLQGKRNGLFCCSKSIFYNVIVSLPFQTSEADALSL